MIGKIYRYLVAIRVRQIRIKTAMSKAKKIASMPSYYPENQENQRNKGSKKILSGLKNLRNLVISTNYMDLILLTQRRMDI